MDSYQPIYDAARSRISPMDGSILREVAWQAFDISHQKAIIMQEALSILYDYQKPSVQMRPKLSLDGNQWCALYGDNLQDGVCGFGDSPALAMEDFNKNWNAKLSTKGEA